MFLYLNIAEDTHHIDEYPHIINVYFLFYIMVLDKTSYIQSIYSIQQYTELYYTPFFTLLISSKVLIPLIIRLIYLFKFKFLSSLTLL